jgi:hypothetical protein
MNNSDWEESTTCCDCAAPLWPDVDRAFACGPDSFLCFACAERRGGRYDTGEDSWVVPPDVSGLPVERRVHP